MASQASILVLALPLVLFGLFMVFVLGNTALSYFFADGKAPIASMMNMPVLIFGAGFICWTYRATRRLAAHLRSPFTERAAEVLARLESFVLILRPFAGSSTVRVLQERSLLYAFVGVEEVVARVVRDELGAKTYTVVDSQVGVLTPGPHHVVADPDDWKERVDELLSRATMVVIVVPPGGELKEGLRWEIERLVAHGFLGRLAIALPRPRHPGYAAARNTLDQILDLLGVQRLGGEATQLVLAYPRVDGSSINWAPQRNSWLIDSEPYRLGLREGIEYARRGKLITTPQPDN